MQTSTSLLRPARPRPLAPETSLSVDVVVPTVARPSLYPLLGALAAEPGGPIASLTVVDDRVAPDRQALAVAVAWALGPVPWPVGVLASGGRGPAAARNAGWRAGRAPWVVFLDDDVVPAPGWAAALHDDLAAAEDRVGAVRGRIEVPLARHRRPTDWERQVHGLATASGWLTADLAVRRVALEQVGGLDERFPRAFREDADLQIRVTDAGWTGVTGGRVTRHPVPPARAWVSVARQRGNADDVLMDRLHGPAWRARVGERPGASATHAVTVGAAATGVAAALAGRRRLAVAGLALWAAATGRFAWRRIAPGPRTHPEVATMALTSIAIPPAAVAHRLAGWWRWRRPARWTPGRGRHPRAPALTATRARWAP